MNYDQAVYMGAWDAASESHDNVMYSISCNTQNIGSYLDSINNIIMAVIIWASSRESQFAMEVENHGLSD